MIGTQVDNYIIVSLLGAGAMGDVYLAEHPGIGRKAAIKVLKAHLAAQRDEVDRFLNEARAVNAIGHAHIVDIMNAGRLGQEGPPYLMMEYLPGETLGARLKRLQRLPVAEALEIASQVADALGAAHREQIIHRDLKPHNVFMVKDASHPAGDFVKVLDFGIAKFNLEAPRSSTKVTRGTGAYMSPEQIRSQGGPLDGRSDIYALGVVLFEMLCGETPFPETADMTVLFDHLEKAPPRPSLKNEAIEPSLEALILRMLAKNRDDRPADMAEVRAAFALERAAVDPAHARTERATPANGLGPSPVPPPAPAPPPIVTPPGPEVNPPARRGTRWLPVGILAAAGLALAFAFGSSKSPPPPVLPTGAAGGAVSSSGGAGERPSVPERVTVDIHSDPTGAEVVGPDGAVMGLTPFHGDFTREAKTLGVTLRKKGYLPREVDVSLGQAFAGSVPLEKRPIPIRPSGGGGARVVERGSELSPSPAPAPSPTSAKPPEAPVLRPAPEPVPTPAAAPKTEAEKPVRVPIWP
jgi:serine/threonine-protein kinase